MHGVTFGFVLVTNASHIQQLLVDDARRGFLVIGSQSTTILLYKVECITNRAPAALVASMGNISYGATN